MGSEGSFELLSDSENISVDLLRPFSTYVFKIAGQTVVGVGTISAAIAVITPEDGENML